MAGALQRPGAGLRRLRRRFVDAVRDAAPALAWRALNPLAREAFLAAPPPPPLTRHAYTARDGRTGVVRQVPLRPGASGEPVVLLSTLGVGPDVFRCGPAPTLVDRLAEAGFGVWLVEHRVGEGDHPGDVDGAAEADLPAALALVAERSGYGRVHVVGHGLGGLIALAWASRWGAERLASLAVLGAPVRAVPPSAWAARVVRWSRAIPGSWTVPGRALARWTAVVRGEGAPRRSGLVHAGQDVPVALLHQLAAWWAAGALVDRGGSLEYGHGLARLAAPLLVGAGSGDALCPEASALAVVDAWRGGQVSRLPLPADFDHLDTALHPRAGEEVHAPLVAWLVRQRARAWREDITELGVRPRPT
ncbi:MAG: alpha/beta fold hydrolase [Alphaproteobacteria bacterium]|nr:alpha/beta fold hydrolase [Alphaproteobacteria bacterium]